MASSANLEQSRCLVYTRSITHFSDRVHGELRATQVHCHYAQLGGHQGAYGGPTRTRVDYYEILSSFVEILFFCMNDMIFMYIKTHVIFFIIFNYLVKR